MVKKMLTLALALLFILTLLASPSLAGEGGAETVTVELNSGVERSGDF